MNHNRALLATLLGSGMLLMFAVISYVTSSGNDSRNRPSFDVSYLIETPRSRELLSQRSRFDMLPFESSKRAMAIPYERSIKEYLVKNPLDYQYWLALLEVQEYRDVSIEERKWTFSNALTTGQWNKKFRKNLLSLCEEVPYKTFRACVNESSKVQS